MPHVASIYKIVEAVQNLNRELVRAGLRPMAVIVFDDPGVAEGMLRLQREEFKSLTPERLRGVQSLPGQFCTIANVPMCVSDLEDVRKKQGI